MPGREIPLVTNEIYHVFNKGINSQTIFELEKDFSEVIKRTQYYRNQNPPMRYSRFVDFSIQTQEEIIKKLLTENKYLVVVIAFCFMPNHFHFILRQLLDGGISKFISQVTNSYTRYFNVKNKNVGPLFQGKFKAISIITDEQLCHLSRYIHLNPFSSSIIKDLKELKNYRYSSFQEYLGKYQVKMTKPNIVLNYFKDNNDYEKFVLDQADYQRNLEIIKKFAID
ncbi:MAG: transposase [Patescibacteria group bacterium]